MWPAAIVALMVGGPLGACLFLAAGITSLVKVSKVDAEYAKRGEMPPSARIVDAWLNRRAKAGKQAKPAKYGMWRYAWQRWQAMWELAATDFEARHRQAIADRNAAGRDGAPTPSEPPLKERVGLSWRWVIDRIVNPVGEKPKPAPSPAAEAIAAEARTACEDCGQTLTRRGDRWVHPSSAGCPNSPSADDIPTSVVHESNEYKMPINHCWSCPKCHATGLDYNTKEDALAASAAHYCHPSSADEDARSRLLRAVAHGTAGEGHKSSSSVDAAPTGDVGYTDEADSQNTPGLGEHSQFHKDMLAKVQRDQAHDAKRWCGRVNCPTCQEDNRLCTNCGAGATRGPLCRTCDYEAALNDPTARLAGQPQPEGDTMTQSTSTQQSGEVVGLTSAINYAEAVAEAHAAHSLGGGETYMASLAQAEVGPETIQSAAAAQEASANAAGAWQAHADKLKEQLAAKEAITAETGKKEFLLSD